MHQAAGEPAQLPALGAVLVRCERRDDDDEAEVGECEVEQQQVRDGSHLTLGQDDVDDQRVAGNARHGDDAEQRRNDHLEQHEVEPAIGD